ncbi:type II secretion system protein [Actomonas aquatica]|uniref:Prepilin-type N-terminal cleavage/methylation domain-containing protein n=1 Tax=Actomonas aquatica TaxID=2866162 RepID=A0ABZ1C9C1_9BACT|nr:prepilin-type N-terminal cleavage/methylation domain-containing protein [Opitutus sp. WL0086]WRQ88007.1 prepilin-type N-terminal cleavage/methylation domain-containing protein [Opitutus sp. WL0086]
MRILPHSQTRAFTLVEIMIAVVIIGLLAAVALPAFTRVTQKTEHTTLVNDLRTFSSAFEQYSLENGLWPADANAGVIPPGMASYLKSDAWTLTAAGNIQWDWEVATPMFNAAIVLSNCSYADDRLRQLDAMLDDGDLTTGIFFKDGGTPVYVLER